MNKPRISIIAAMDEKRGIGKGNDLLFKIPEDFRRMKQLTLNHPIIMGRKTYESIGRVLPKRSNIIITRDSEYTVEGAFVFASLEKAIAFAKKKDTEEIFIFGGGQVFREALPVVDRLYLTLVKGDFGADTFFPDYSEFAKIVEREGKSADGYEYEFLMVER